MPICASLVKGGWLGHARQAVYLSSELNKLGGRSSTATTTGSSHQGASAYFLHSSSWARRTKHFDKETGRGKADFDGLTDPGGPNASRHALAQSIALASQSTSLSSPVLISSANPPSSPPLTVTLPAPLPTSRAHLDRLRSPYLRLYISHPPLSLQQQSPRPPKLSLPQLLRCRGPVFFSTMPSTHPHGLSSGRRAAAVLLTDQLEKPSLDDRDYRVIRLENELEALLVHDPETDKASASLDVNVGNFSDEDSMPGMAHAVEHVSTAFAPGQLSLPTGQ